MPYTSSNRAIVRDVLLQIQEAICRIEEWNKNILSSNDYASSPEGMKTLAATCMELEAIGEGVKSIEKRTEGTFLNVHCPEIPWKEIISMRNHIAHGYFQIDIDFVFDTVKSDLNPLNKAVSSILNNI